jgi:superfamily I DNA/RNA helicase
MTMHGMGFRAIAKSFKLREGAALNEHRVAGIIEELSDINVWTLRSQHSVFFKAVQELVRLCKMSLIGMDFAGKYEDDESLQYAWDDILDEITRAFDIDLGSFRRNVYDYVPVVLERCKDVAKDGQIDFNDMIWLPIVLNLPMFRYDLLLGDEVQDWNRCQQELAMRCGDRLVLCGDPKQAIYGFMGSDARSMERMSITLKENNSRDVLTLPLTVTRRCGKAIVREANKLVPDFEAFPTNPDGLISYARYTNKPEYKREYNEEGPSTAGKPIAYADTYIPGVRDGDFVLCRANAPLVEQCFKFLKAGRKAKVIGRDIGKGILTLIDKLLEGWKEGTGSENQEDPKPADLIRCLDEWLVEEEKKERAKRMPSEGKLRSLLDRYECLMTLTEGAKTIQELKDNVDKVFTDTEGGGIRLSSIHRAKGLEANRVFLLVPEGAQLPHPAAKMNWEMEQESNLLYVAQTRAIHELIYVS